MTLQEQIIEWRFSNSTPKRIVGFWIKSLIEGGIIVGIPVVLFIYGFIQLMNITVREIVPFTLPTQHPRLLATFILIIVGWLRMRCLLTDQLE